MEPISTQASQPSVVMTKDRIKTIGISLLGSPENDGEFELGIDELFAVNAVGYNLLPLKTRMTSILTERDHGERGRTSAFEERCC